ncbi:MAG: hypothetical protein KatS3mg111_1197 [Pirellulaceae bacterium]|nr:MAG: hypothetical protein KatS3mg111_1197 [Pirellulaceae bacterium]
MRPSTTPITMLCTVGGSHAPIVRAIRDSRPDFVWFICTDGPHGSITQIRGPGNCIKAHPRDEKPTLPNIPTQVGLREDQYDVLTVPPDDPDEIHVRIRALIENILSTEPRPRIIADYTGGTKSMTAALLLAGLEYDEDVELSIVVGQRADLVQVKDGTETRLPANVDRIRFRHKFRVAMAPWQHYGYAEAAIALKSMLAPRDAGDRQVYLDALAASRAFAAWDRFDHHRAHDLLQPLGRTFGSYLAMLSRLNSESEVQTPARLLDLSLNMQRRAARGQYDDAVARAYRLLEWTAQWLLSRDAGIDTSNVPSDRIPAGIELPQNDKGHHTAGLRNAWALLETLGGTDTVRTFARERTKEMLNLLAIRNHSILAHGFQPITQTQWSAWQTWLDDTFLPFLQAQARTSGIKKPPSQLPTEFTVSLDTKTE